MLANSLLLLVLYCLCQVVVADAYPPFPGGFAPAQPEPEPETPFITKAAAGVAAGALTKGAFKGGRKVLWDFLTNNVIYNTSEFALPIWAGINSYNKVGRRGHPRDLSKQSPQRQVLRGLEFGTRDSINRLGHVAEVAEAFRKNEAYEPGRPAFKWVKQADEHVQTAANWVDARIRPDRAQRRGGRRPEPYNPPHYAP